MRRATTEADAPAKTAQSPSVRGDQVQLLLAAEDGGVVGAIAWLDARDLDWIGKAPPGAAARGDTFAAPGFAVNAMRPCGGPASAPVAARWPRGRRRSRLRGWSGDAMRSSGGPGAHPSRLIPYRLGWTHRWSSACLRHTRGWPAAQMLLGCSGRTCARQCGSSRASAGFVGNRTRRNSLARHRSWSLVRVRFHGLLHAHVVRGS